MVGPARNPREVEGMAVTAVTQSLVSDEWSIAAAAAAGAVPRDGVE